MDKQSCQEGVTCQLYFFFIYILTYRFFYSIFFKLFISTDALDSKQLSFFKAASAAFYFSSTSFMRSAGVFPAALKEFPHVLSICWLLTLPSQLLPNYLAQGDCVKLLWEDIVDIVKNLQHPASYAMHFMFGNDRWESEYTLSLKRALHFWYWSSASHNCSMWKSPGRRLHYHQTRERYLSVTVKRPESSCAERGRVRACVHLWG